MTRPRPRLPDNVELALAGLVPMRVAELRRLWVEWFNEDPPACQSAEFLRHLAAWRLQEARFGGLSADTARRLRRLRSSSASPGTTPSFLKPGTMIAREWRGKVQRVHVLEDGFAFQGKTYGSLSEIARLITGKRWSGPRFFGVERKAAADAGDLVTASEKPA